MLNFVQLLTGAHRLNASDLHLASGEPPVLRVDGTLRAVNAPVVTGDDMRKLILEIIPDRAKAALDENRGADFAYRYKDMDRYRCVTFYVQNELCLTMRRIPLQIPTLDELHLPQVLKEISLDHRGMTLLTGITGSGKSTTLASMINHLNSTEARRVVTIEDPVEFLLPTKKCLISQRQIGIDVPDFAHGLRQAMRMDPDVILIGEMRDVETIRIAIKAAETGHLVFSTLHTTSAVHTIQRILGHFDETEHDMIREQLALNLKASMTQRLARASCGTGRRAALEILRVNSTVSKLINDNRIPDIFSVIRSRDAGMQVMDQALADLINEDAVTMEEAAKLCDDYYALRRYVRGVDSSGDGGAILSA